MSAFVDAGMHQFIDQDRIVTCGERCKQSEIRFVPRIKIYRRFRSDEFRKAPFQLLMLGMIAS